jgi:hypothetical protein
MCHGAMGQTGLLDLFQPSLHEAQADLMVDARGVLLISNDQNWGYATSVDFLTK